VMKLPSAKDNFPRAIIPDLATSRCYLIAPDPRI
jgi:hypothetical protein